MSRPVTIKFDFTSIQPGKVRLLLLDDHHRALNLAWLRGTRKNPPSLDETVVQEQRRQELAEQVHLSSDTFSATFSLSSQPRCCRPAMAVNCPKEERVSSTLH